MTETQVQKNNQKVQPREKGIMQTPQQPQSNLSITREQVEAIQFDPNEVYRWKANEKFNLNGNEFELLFNNMLALVSSPISVDTMFKMMTVYKMLETKLKIGIIEGKILIGSAPEQLVSEKDNITKTENEDFADKN